jgi:hypothetical protein
MITRSQAARFGFVLLVVAACVNLGAGVTLALRDPGRASDLWAMYDWCRAWLLGAESLYTGPDASTDYPPNAIVMLAPLAFVPQSWLVPLWTAGAVALTPVLPWLVLRSASRGDRATLAVPMLLFFCWAATRTLLQFSLLSMTLSCVALLIVDSRGLAAGVALGLGLMKPHIAGPIALWMLVTGRIRPLVAGAAVIVAGWAVYDARIGENPLTTAVGYWHVLGSEYAGPFGLVGKTGIRGWTQTVTADSGTADALWVGLSALLLAGACWLATRDRQRALDAGGLAVPSLFCLWSLLAIYHNGNNMILMLPAFTFLWFLDDRRTSPSHWIPIVVLQAVLMFDVPVRLSATALDHPWGRMAIDHFDRVAVVATFAYVAAGWYRLTVVRMN